MITVVAPLLVAGAMLATGCASADDDSAPLASVLDSTPADQFPSILDVEPMRENDGTWSFAVTVSSPYDTPERYADGWRVLGPDGTVYGEHLLTHDHASEQPFTRRQTGVAIPVDVETVTIEGRDQNNGYGGDTVTVALQTDDDG